MIRAAMQVYTIHLPPPYSAAGAEPEAVREGFSVPAFLLTGLWALAHRMWIRGAALLAALAALWALSGLAGLGIAGTAVLFLAFMAWVGMEAADWHRDALARRGWREAAVVAAESEDGALRRYADLLAISGPPRSGPPAASAPSGETAPA